MKLAKLKVVAILAAVAGCTNASQKPVETVHQGQPAQHIGTLEGALISENIQAGVFPGNNHSGHQASNRTLIVQCPSCHQRVDVTGLPRESIRCPNCNSLFTY